jgi:hypothetical protein
VDARLADFNDVTDILIADPIGSPELNDRLRRVQNRRFGIFFGVFSLQYFAFIWIKCYFLIIKANNI